MNLVLIGLNSTKKFAEVVKSNFDNVDVYTFDSVDRFIQEVSIRFIQVHRMILLQDSIQQTDDSRLANYSEFMAKYYPQTRIISVCRDTEQTQRLGTFCESQFTVHLCIPTIKAHMLVDLTADTQDILKNKYKDFMYVRPITSIAQEVNPDSEPPEGEGEQGVASEQQKKKGLFGGLFGGGKKPKKEKPIKGKKGKGEQTLRPIGQGDGVTEFSTTVATPDFKETDDDEDMQFGIFAMDGKTDLGVGGYPDELPEPESLPEPEEEPLVPEPDVEAEELAKEWGTMPDPFADMPQEEFPMEELPEEEPPEELETVPVAPELPEPDGDSGLDLDEVTPEEPAPVGVGQEMPQVPDSAGFDSIKNRLEEKQFDVNIESPVLKPKADIPTEDAEIDLLPVGDMTQLEEAYDQQKNPVRERVVEKVVEKVVTVRERGSRHPAGVRLVLVTGDRRSGVTRLALNLASYYSQSSATLYVDFDVDRHGSLLYLGVADIMDEEEHIQDGLTHVKDAQMLKNVCYLYPEGNFHCLVSRYDSAADAECLSRVQKYIAAQSHFATVVVDCPIEYLHLMDDIILSGDILICCEDNTSGVFNTLFGLDRVPEESKFFTLLYNNSAFVVTKGGNISKFQHSMEEAASLFALDSTRFDWSKTAVIGSVKDLKGIVERL